MVSHGKGSSHPHPDKTYKRHSQPARSQLPQRVEAAAFTSAWPGLLRRHSCRLQQPHLPAAAAAAAHLWLHLLPPAAVLLSC
jgi:hypothetical protein